MENEEVIFEESETAKKLAHYKLPRYEELTKYNIFMNQLVDILDEHLSVFALPTEGKILTPSMINNYVFKHVVIPPNQKKYNRDHIAYLIAVGIMKQVLPISDVTTIINGQVEQYNIAVAYDYFCRELENMLQIIFESRNFSDIEKTNPSKVTPLSRKARSAILAFVNQIYVKHSIFYDNRKNR